MQFRLPAMTMFATAVLVAGDVRGQNAGKISDSQKHLGRWRHAGDMSERREYGGGVRLKDGRILAVSGHPLDGKSIASTELFDPATGKWSNTGSLRQARNSGNSATLLQDGRVLLAGGHSNTEVIRGADLYDPATGKWSDAGLLSVGRDPVATRLADGRVLVAGGIDWYTDNGKVYAVAEIYDPAAGKWTPTGSLTAPRYQQQATLLDDGRVLAVGGYRDQNADTLIAGSELYDPATGQWQESGELPLARAWFGQVKLNDGRVLVVGGYTGRSRKRTYLSSAAIYDPKSGRWSDTEPMKAARGGFSIARLPDGQVLVAGGVAEGGLELKTAELFDPSTQSWRTAAPMKVARRNHRAAVLPDGGVLVIGGSSVFGSKFLNSCEIFSL